MSQTLLLAVMLLAGTAMSQVSLPLTKRSVSSNLSYEPDHFFTADLSVAQNNLNSIIDLQSSANWVTDSTCNNCAAGNANSPYTCGSACGETVTDSPPLVVFGQKVRVASHNAVTVEAKLGQNDLKLTEVVDIVSLKDNTLNQGQQSLSQVNSGLGFSIESSKNENSALSQLIAANKETPKTFSLFFNENIGRLIVGKSEQFFSKGEGKVLHTVEGESWSVLVGPYLQLGSAPNVSANSEEVPDVTTTKGLFTAKLDSTTKFISAPKIVWDRLNLSLFQHNNCQEDKAKNNVCDCSGSWIDIELDLVLNPVEDSLTDNTAHFAITPEQYLEKTSTSGKCLLLIKPRESDAILDYVFGTSFLQNFYTVYNLENQTILLAESHGFVPASKHIDNTLLWVFVGVGIFLALLAIALLFAIFKRTRLTEEDLQVLQHRHPKEAPVKRNISYLVSSPREIESIQQITKSGRIQAPIGTPIHAKVISSPQRNLTYSNHNLVQYQ